jgi:hypothetical protein
MARACRKLQKRLKSTAAATTEDTEDGPWSPDPEVPPGPEEGGNNKESEIISVPEECGKQKESEAVPHQRDAFSVMMQSAARRG